MAAELLDWNAWVHSAPGAAHFLAALLALGLGPVVFLRVKGDALHRILGTVWVVAMLAVNGSALTMYEASGGPNLFHFFAALSLAAVIPGYCLIRAYARSRRCAFLSGHVECMMWAYYGLVAAGVSQIVLRILPSPPGALGLSVWGLAGALFACAGVTHIVAKRAASRAVRRYHQPRGDAAMAE